MVEKHLQRKRDALEARQQSEQETLEASQPPDDFQKRFDALYEKRRQEPTTVRPPPKPQGNKPSPKITIGKNGATLQPTTGGKGVGGGVKATFKFK